MNFAELSTRLTIIDPERADETKQNPVRRNIPAYVISNR
jgi:hypothetical protein